MPVELSPSLRCTHVAHLLPSFCFGPIYRWATISSVYLLIILPVCVVSCLWCVRVCSYAFPFPFVIVSVALPGCWWFDCDFMARNVVDASIAGELSTLKRIEGGKGMGEKGSVKGSQDASAWFNATHKWCANKVRWGRLTIVPNKIHLCFYCPTMAEGVDTPPFITRINKGNGSSSSSRGTSASTPKPLSNVMWVLLLAALQLSLNLASWPRPTRRMLNWPQLNLTRRDSTRLDLDHNSAKYSSCCKFRCPQMQST